MNRLPHDDERLSAFLRQYRPVPPPANSNLEKQLMAELEKQPIHFQRNYYLPLRLFFLALISALLGWGSYRLFSPSPNIAELELFLVSNWNDVIDEIPQPSPTDSPEIDWLLLTDTDSSSSNR
jgi:hypothetical protein